MTTGDEFLDLDGVSRRNEKVRFDILDAYNVPTGRTLDVDRDNSPTITVDVDRSIRRTMDNLIIPANAESVDFFRERIQPRWILSNGDEYPLGVFLFADATRNVTTYGSSIECNLVDQCLILDQDLSETVSYDGENITGALAEQAAGAGVVSPLIENTLANVSTPTAWTAGRDSRLKVMEDLCALAGFLAPYFDNDGNLVCRDTPDWASATPDFIYDSGTIIIANTISESDDLLRAPNRYRVTDTGSSDNEITGVFDVPASEPFSEARRGYIVQKSIEMQGLENDAAAEAAAVAAYLQDVSAYRWLQFSTTPDPRHDVFDLIESDGIRYREVGWSLELRAGGEMTHDLRAVTLV